MLQSLAFLLLISEGHAVLGTCHWFHTEDISMLDIGNVPVVDTIEISLIDIGYE